MNSKQRKAAEKIRARALLDADGKIAEIERRHRDLAAQRLAFDEERNFWKEQAEIDNLKLRQDREELKQITKAGVEALGQRRRDFLEQERNLEGVNVLREVILLLELDEEPDQIALKIRQQFGLLIPEW